jgi:hypothetical protein
MHSPEEINKKEQGIEGIPSRENIIAQIQKYYEGATILRELSDEEGIYLLEANELGEKEGESTLYLYQRIGNFGKNAAAKTVIEKIYFKNDIPYGGDIIAEYDEATGEWIEK